MAQSSYVKLKARNVTQQQEIERVLLSLQLTRQEKNDIEAKYKIVCKDLHDTQREQVAIASELGLVRIQLQHETNKMEEISKRMTEEKWKIEKKSGIVSFKYRGFES